jgi:hypothetical protein
VRRLVEYEDHLLRLMRDAGLPTPRPYGFVEQFERAVGLYPRQQLRLVLKQELGVELNQ